MRKRFPRTVLVVAAVSVAAVSLGCGRVTRQMHFNSQPQGALVYLNGQEVGQTPCTVDFTWYGNYDMALRKDGYESIRASRKVYAPWWQWMPLDLAADLLPGRKIDKRYYHYVLTPLPDTAVDPEKLIDRANAMRPLLESGQFTRTPSPARDHEADTTSLQPAATVPAADESE